MKRLLLLYTVSILGACTRQPRQRPEPAATSGPRAAAPAPSAVADAAPPAEPRADGIVWREVTAIRLDAGDRIIEVHNLFTSSGATLTATAVGAGHLLWTTELQALGPIAHSQYSNQVGIALQDGMIVVFGDEAGGRYIEVVTLDGRTTSNHRLPAQP